MFGVYVKLLALAAALLPGLERDCRSLAVQSLVFLQVDPPPPDWTDETDPNVTGLERSEYEFTSVAPEDWLAYTRALPHFRLGNRNVLIHNGQGRIYYCRNIEETGFPIGSTPFMLKESYLINSWMIGDTNFSTRVYGVIKGGRVALDYSTMRGRLIWKRDSTLGDATYANTRNYTGYAAMYGIVWTPTNPDYPRIPDNRMTSVPEMANPWKWFAWGPGAVNN